VDEQQAQGMEVRRRRSRAETEQVVAAYGASGLSRVEFCKQQGLSLATLARYRKQQRQQGEAATGNRWLAVEVSGVGATVGRETASGLAVALPGGRRIEVGRGFDAPTLLQLLGVLEGR
jgi:transposase-like protein